MGRFLKWIYWIAGGLAAVIIVLIAMTGDPFLTWAFLTAEQRPALLKDAGWNDPASAKAFGNRFHAGVPEAELLAWLADQDFEIDRGRRTADRAIGGLPCNERAFVTWTVDAGSRLANAEAILSEAGCL